jgi:hypothetical protein
MLSLFNTAHDRKPNRIIMVCLALDTIAGGNGEHLEGVRCSHAIIGIERSKRPFGAPRA